MAGGARLLNVSDKLTANFHWNLPIVQIIIGVAQCSAATVLGVMGDWEGIRL